MLKVQDLYKRFGGVSALAGFSCSISEKEVVGLIGPNGSGKTTLFNILTGLIQADRGSATFGSAELLGLAPHQIACEGIARTFQDLRMARSLSVLENVLLAYRDQPGEHIGNCFLRWGKSQEVELQHRMAAFRLLDQSSLADKAHEQAAALSYGEQKLLSLLSCIASGADLLLLDEPVAGIADEMIDKVLQMIRTLPSQGRSVLLIEHNIDAVTQVCDRVIFLAGGLKVAEGGPREVQNDPRVADAYLR